MKLPEQRSQPFTMRTKVDTITAGSQQNCTTAHTLCNTRRMGEGGADPVHFWICALLHIGNTEWKRAASIGWELSKIKEGFAFGLTDDTISGIIGFILNSSSRPSAAYFL